MASAETRTDGLEGFSDGQHGVQFAPDANPETAQKMLYSRDQYWHHQRSDPPHRRPRRRMLHPHRDIVHRAQLKWQWSKRVRGLYGRGAILLLLGVMLRRATERSVAKKFAMPLKRLFPH